VLQGDNYFEPRILREVSAAAKNISEAEIPERIILKYNLDR